MENGELPQKDPAPQGSTRKRAIQRMTRVSTEMRRAGLILSDVHQVYAPREKALGEAVAQLIKIIAMAEEMADDIRSHI